MYIKSVSVALVKYCARCKFANTVIQVPPHFVGTIIPGDTSLQTEFT